jgi:hypothetical protein
MKTLLAADDTDQRVRPLRHWQAADRAQVAQALGDVVQARALRWPTYARSEMAAPRIQPNAQDLCEAMAEDPLLASARWSAWGPDAAPACWWTLLRASATEGAVPSSENARHGIGRTRAVEPRPVLLAMLFGETEALRHGAAAERVADQLADRAWADLGDALAAALDVPTSMAAMTPDVLRLPPANEGLPQALLRPWEGSLLVRLPWCGAVLVLAVPGAIAAQWLRTQRAATPPEAARAQVHASRPAAVLEALAGARVAFDLRLASVEMSLGTLATLRVGDILCTTHDLETPLGLHTRNASDPDDLPVCAAFLGRQGSRRAIELLPPNP